ncbi:hypothetical protein A1O3_00955 [Capronia epimyces CBS 606.96]|uniref:DUF3074 domain-containing protein n=1 Tax=Capronia epimyces CBS 606.96 TaxID=1182542 RepID=W9ZD28_9EURO|nr:uncharacterized protein A1O3_00955 [Capronia epimyces CBS 606.96]EXJ92404.1 hypothetical protein A1O3_00955 [Capronia epimyces CBS 606.96]
MADLHSALKALAPCNFSDIPQQPDELDRFMADLFEQSQCVVESIPIPDPDPSLQRDRAHTAGYVASNASEIAPSPARSPPPAPKYAALQKEWGKTVKLSPKENPLGLSVYKLAGKDGKGAWFARRSVHEGLGFSRFKRAFEREFPTSLDVKGAPGEGNIRGIGAETRVEDITVPNRGKIEVYQLSAQFPGPTTPRDFVTLLVTSSRAIKPYGEAQKVPELAPRHYMIISKPCNHPETQPRDGFVRGHYESVEFIREVPRKLKATISSTDLSRLSHDRASSPSGAKADIPSHHNTQQHDDKHLRVDTQGSAIRELSPSGRKRSATVGVPTSPSKAEDPGEHYDPEQNPVEWIMVTRSDPGGSVPRFMVERGTPGSICADAVKFLDWACQREDDEESLDTAGARPDGHRRESFPSWEANGTLAGIREHEGRLSTIADDQPQPSTSDATAAEQTGSTKQGNVPSPEHSTASPSHVLEAVAATIGAYAPQVIRDHLPNATEKGMPLPGAEQSDEQHSLSRVDIPEGDSGGSRDYDGSSTVSAASFASADSHLDSDESPSVSSKSMSNTPENQLLQQHDKEIAKLAERKAAMEAKFAQQKEKINSQASKETEKEQQALKKAEAKHERELRKQEEKFQKELAKLEEKKKKEAKKMEEKKRKQTDKDEKARLTRERDEARAELELLKKEQEIYMRQIGELQKENTILTARIGKLEGSGSSLDSPPGGPQRLRAMTMAQESPSRSSSLLGRTKKNNGNKSDMSSDGP